MSQMQRVPFPTEPTADETGERLRMVRDALGLPQGTFCKRAGIGQSAYSQYESGERRCSLDAGIKLCHRYGLTLDWIFMGDHTALPASLVEAMNAVRAHRARARADD